ncbi:hypothetical protein E1A91_D13G099900v1 [Gossypium mustelinum]|uniref:Uncharacterized protein n=2 Tax=Gossypium TaxID=3633 RepID=A0A5D2S2H2_GOSMU|nr:hypothetical protein ES332_D13G103600v1 [Gossypium tomentosum]TYI46325.1 hypothetical protein E1A91_D13G099900v1 [Gossypium mustelinum]
MVSLFILFLLPFRPTLLFPLSLSFFIFTFLPCAVQTSVLNLMSRINSDDWSCSHFRFGSKQCKLTCRFESKKFVDVALFWLNP